MTPTRSPAKQRSRLDRERLSGVVDIGSNTVRMVIYGGPPRAPVTVWNEKVAARLGRDLATTGSIPKEASDDALGALARYRVILDELEVADVQTVATAAAREADNGGEFLDKVRALGLDPRLLSGEEEAVTSAWGAIGAFPGAEGVVADLGGGSLELVSIAQGTWHHGESLPLGTLRLPSLRMKKGFARRVKKAFGKVGWAQAHPGPLYMVGGTWRALAQYAMHSCKYPLTDPHAFELAPDEALRLCARLARSKPEKLMRVPGISPMRAGYLSDAAALLRVMIEQFEPDRLVFSSWGIREGLLYARLDDLQRAKDPLLVGIADFARMYEAQITDATLVAGWTADVATGEGNGTERLRLAAALLCMALQRVEPNLRANHATEWSLDKRWIGIDAADRAMLCASLLGSLGRTEMPKELRRLASDAALRTGTGWGLAIRLARRLGASSRGSIGNSSLRRTDKELVLRLSESHAALAHYPLTKDLEVLADWLGLDSRIETGEV